MGFYAIRLSLLTMTIVVYPYRLMAAWLAVGAQAAMIWLVSLENHLHLSSTSTPNIYWLMVMGAYTVRLQTWLRRNVINDDPFEFGVLLAILVLPALLFIADNLPPLGRCCSLAGYQPLSTENEAHVSFIFIIVVKFIFCLLANRHPPLKVHPPFSHALHLVG